MRYTIGLQFGSEKTRLSECGGFALPELLPKAVEASCPFMPDQQCLQESQAHYKPKASLLVLALA